jgi:GNAT superfamily N-acetyltransferase
MTIAAGLGHPRRVGVIAASRPGGSDAPDNLASNTLEVYRASATEALSVIDLMAEAFLNDPTWSWAFPDPAGRRQWWTFCVTEALHYPWTFRTEGFETTSVWIPPSCSEFSDAGVESIPGKLAHLLGPRAPEVAELLHRFELAHPHSEPHYYLSLLGTRADHRGRGLGMALLKENLARIDAEHMPAYLESSNPSNNHRYESVGFVPVASFQAPGVGPVVTGMWRKSR